MMVNWKRRGLIAFVNVGEAGPDPQSANILPFGIFVIFGGKSEISPRRSAATRFKRQMATGAPSRRPRRQAGSHGRSQVRPKMPGNTFDCRLSRYDSVKRPCAISLMYSGTL